MKIFNPLVFLFLITNSFAQEEADAPLISCVANPLNAHTSINHLIDYKNLKTESTSSIVVKYSNFPSNAKAAFQAAIDVWQRVLVSRVQINIEASWDAINSTTLATTTTNKVYKNFEGTSIKEVYYPPALAEAIAGKNINGSNPEIVIKINKNISWSYLTDGQREAFKYDLMTVVMHEIAHGLGFTSSLKVDGNNLTQGTWGLDDGLPLIYDLFVQNQKNEALTNSAIFGKPSTELKNQIISGNLFFKIENGPFKSDLPKVYSPSPYRSGGSISHLDEQKYPKGTTNSLMSPAIGAAEVNHFPGDVILTILNQLGWGVNYLKGVVITSKEPENISDQFFIFPNPAKESFRLILPQIYQNQNITIAIYALSGRLVKTKQINTESSDLVYIGDLEPGHYIIKLPDSSTKRLIKY